MASPSAPAIAPSALAAVGGPGSATVADLNIAPGTALHEVKKGDSVPGIVRQYLPQTKFMTGSELEAGLRKTNLDLKGIWPKPGTTLIVPEFIAGPWIEKPVAKAKDYEVRAIYLTGTMAGSARGLEIIHKWRNAGGNAVVFDVKDSDGLVNVPFQHPLAPPTQRVAIRNLPKFTRYLHGLGLHAIARIAVFRDEHIAVHHPEMTIRSRRSGEPWKENGKLVWADPSRSEIWDYNIALARFAAESGADEVQFDYVRFPAEGDQKDAKFAYETEHPQWKRSDAVTHFLEKAHSQLWPMGVLLSLDVFGIMAWQRPVDLSHTGQNIPEMARHCDILSPMIYPSHFFGMDGYALPGDAAEHFISESMERFQKITAGSGVVLRPWLQAFGWKTKTYSPEYIITQVRVAHEKGGIGFLFWNASNDYGKPFAAMPVMRATPGKFFRGDEIGSTALPAVDKTLSQPDASSKGQ
ncbi:MAG TPA: putative glycoside hydrolase [Clostridia bacterium]|nr:putative glycoside hydrolase [Clostridia bacterium]